MSLFEHDALLYDGTDDFVEHLVPFVRDGIAQDEAVLAVTSQANAGALREALGADAGRVDFHDSTVWYASPGRAFGAYADYVAGTGGRRLRAIGEPVWPVGWDEGVEEWARYESVLNVAFADARAWIVCPYDTTSQSDSILEHARHTHPTLHDRGERAPHDAYVEPRRFWAALDESPPPPVPGARELAVTTDLASLRATVAAAATAAGVQPLRVTDLVFAVHELAVNALTHGSGEGVVRIWREEGRFVCEVADCGPGLSERFAGYDIPPPDQTRGRGIWLARRLCDLVEVRSGEDGTRIRLHTRVS